MNVHEELDMIRLETEQRLNKVNSELNELIALTEDKYSYIYESLPVTEEAIKFSIREVDILLSYLLYKTDGELGQINQSVTVDALGRIQQEFEEVTESFLNQELIGVLTRTFLDDSGQDEQSFSEMGRLVREVKDTLSDLRDLALNSIIFSIRVGEEGAGFQILADRINQISSSLGEEFSNMDNTMSDLDNWNREFQKKLTDFVEYEENLKTKYQNKFEQEFLKINKVLQVTCELLNNHLRNAETIVMRVPEAMVLIQNQDIIRQNIENLVKCLQVVIQKKGSFTGESRDEALNHIVFVKKVSELSAILLDNIENGLDDSIVALEKVLEEINDQAGNLEVETHYLGSFFAGAGEGIVFDFQVIQDVFRTVIGQVVDLLYIKRHLETKSEFLIQGRETFVRLMESVEHDFEAINSQIRTLKKMRVLIKIELSRITQGDNSMQSIAAAVDQVVETVYNNQVMFNKLRDYFVRNMDEFNRAVEKTRTKLSNSSEVLEVSKCRLSTAQNLVTGAVQAMVLEMGQIYDGLKKPYTNIQVREQVKEMIFKMRKQLIEYYEVILAKETELFNYYGVDQWEEKEEDLKALLNQFTCFVERKSATSVFQELDAGMDDHSSDIVLF